LLPETGIESEIRRYRVAKGRTGKIQEKHATPFGRYRLSFDYTAFQKALAQLAQA